MIKVVNEITKDDVKVYTVAIGNLPTLFSTRKTKRMAKEAIDFIKELNGFIGLHPAPPYGTLCLFETELQARRARFLMDDKGIKTGKNICEAFINKSFIKKGDGNGSND